MRIRTMPVLVFSLLLHACTATSQKIESKSLGKAVTEAEVLASIQNTGPIQFQKVIAADWTIERRGLIDLNDPKSQSAGLKPGMEEIQAYFYVIDHPTQGRFMIDSGISQQMKDNYKESPMGGIVGGVLNVSSMKARISTKEWLAQNPGEVKGLFFTHLHLDHLMGVIDLPEATALYVGPGEASHRNIRNVFSQLVCDKLLAGDRTVSELTFGSEKRSILDIFGDQSFFAIWAPGHTKGSLAFLANTTSGPQLMVGDNSHTRWGWEHEVTPGYFSAHHGENQKSLHFLRELAGKIPNLQVHLGHQSLASAEAQPAAPQQEAL